MRSPWQEEPKRRARKRTQLRSRRERIKIPPSPQPLPEDHIPLLQAAFDEGSRHARRFITAPRIDEEMFREEREAFRKQAAGNDGFFHLLCSLFFYGAYNSLQWIMKRERISDKSAWRNFFLCAVSANLEMSDAILRLPDSEIESLFQLSEYLSHVLKRWWRSHVAGSLAVSQLARFLVLEGRHVYLPFPNEDAYFGIDLIAKTPGDSVSACFQVKSDAGVARARYTIYRELPNGDSTEATHRFYTGVGKFQKRHLGIYIPVEVTCSFKPGAVHSIILKARDEKILHRLLAELSVDDPDAQPHALTLT